ncbi:MAG: hypothetical protein CL433_11465 [Acidimicrobiaceae bacterium]|jgi:hypothetical protein|nr:hypothetical protein [Acidimicrobiaceae bacterium]HAB58176.1 hypothetical protein [Acidimicrobiaceae bacterium]
MAAKPKRFKRRLFGYGRAAVDARLDELTDTIEALEHQAAAAASHQDDLVLRATRLSVAAVMEQAEADAKEIRQSARNRAAAIPAGTDSADLDHLSDA